MASRRRSKLGSTTAAPAPVPVNAGDNNEDRTSKQQQQQSSAGALAIPDKFDLVADDFALEDSQEDQELKELERRLNTEVEEDLFEEPRKFKYVLFVFDW